MKPIILNLLAEQQLAEEASAHDPVKTAILIAIVVLGLAGVTGMAVNWRTSRQEAEANQLKKRYDMLTAQATEGTGGLRAWKMLAGDLAAINNSRSVFARQLALIKDVVPDTIQLARIGLAVSTEAGGSAPSADAGGEGGKTRRAPRVGSERLTLRLEGKAECPRPEIEVEAFVKALQTAPALKDLMEQVQLRSIARSTAEGGATAAQFVIECRYKVLPL